MNQTKTTNFLTIILALCALVASVAYIWQYLNSRQNDQSTIWYQQYGHIVERSGKSVVAIESQQPTGINGLSAGSAGSGFIIDSAGYIVTNEHVVHLADRIQVTLADKRQYIAEIIGVDTRSDIAVLKIDAEDLSSLPIGSTDQLAPGQIVIVMGNPMGTASDGKAVATFGHINRLNQSLDSGIDLQTSRYYNNLIQTDAITLPGSSGGPLLNELGFAVGIITAMSANQSNQNLFGFAITLDKQTLEKIEQLKSGRQPEHAFMGVILARNIDQVTQERLGLKEISGALVASPMLGFPAHKAGILTGDLIRAINSRRVYSSNELISYIDSYRSNEVIHVELIRAVGDKAETTTIPVRLTTRNENDVKGYRWESEHDSILVWGMEIKPLTPWRKTFMNLSQAHKGVLVYGVEPDSPALSQNIKLGSIIIQIGDDVVTNIHDFIEIAKKYSEQIPQIKILQLQPSLEVREDI